MGSGTTSSLYVAATGLHHRHRRLCLQRTSRIVWSIYPHYCIKQISHAERSRPSMLQIKRLSEANAAVMAASETCLPSSGGWANTATLFNYWERQGVSKILTKTVHGLQLREDCSKRHPKKHSDRTPKSIPIESASSLWRHRETQSGFVSIRLTNA